MATIDSAIAKFASNVASTASAIAITPKPTATIAASVNLATNTALCIVTSAAASATVSTASDVVAATTVAVIFVGTIAVVPAA